jgi:GAF domain-containing protein
VGSLNLYADQPEAFDAVAEALADVLAAQAATSIEHSAVYAATRRLTDLVQQRSEEEQDIAVAEGVVSVLHTCSVEQAGRLLRQESAGSHELLVRAARRILDQIRP